MATNLGMLDQLKQIGRWRDEAEWTRVREQIRFAEWMSTQKNAKPAWRGIVAEAMECVRAQGGRLSGAELCGQVESVLRPMAAAAKKFTVHCAGHAHIDMNWQWSWPETVGVTLDTFRTMLTLLEEFPEFHFSQSQASVYAIVEKYEPAMLGRIARFVKAGRWEVTASHWVENDPNLAGAEALAQHLLQTRAYMKELFGLAPEDVAIDFAPDSFGFAATTPSYLAQGGVKHVYLHRPGNLKQPVPEVFTWQGPDGATVLVHNAQRIGYNAVIDPNHIISALVNSVPLGLDCGLLFYGVGDHGGGPTRRDLLYAREMAQWPVFPEIKLCASREYYERVAASGAKLPVIKGELNFEVTGCYTTQTLIKRDNRFGEARMQDAETAAALGKFAAGVSLCRKSFAENWRRVLFSHFHDILPGSGVRDTRMYCHGQFQETSAFTSVATAQALRAIAAKTDTSGFGADAAEELRIPAQFLSEGFGAGSGIGAVDGSFGLAHGHGFSPVRPFAVFNTTGAERTETVKFTVWDREFWETRGMFAEMMFEAVGADGKLLPSQRLETGGAWGHANQTYAVTLTVPPMGYSTLAFRHTLEPKPAQGGVSVLDADYHCSYVRKDRGEYGMENEHLRVSIDSATGRIASVFDKDAGAEMLDPSVGIALEYSVERSESMSAWIIDKAGPAVFPELTEIRRRRKGPISASIDLVFKAGRSVVRLTYRLAAGSRRVGISFSADWLEAGNAANGSPNLRLAIGSALPAPKVTCEIPFGALERAPLPDDCEFPALRWALLESENAGNALLVMNDCKHGHALSGSTLRVNLIRSAFDPDPFPELGQHQAEFALEVVPRGTDRAALIAKAQAFNHPLLIMGTSVHAGDLPGEAALVKIGGRNVALSGVKSPSDGSEGLIIRLCNVADQPAPYALTFGKLLGKPKKLAAADLLERPIPGPPLKKIPPRGILTLRAEF